MLARRRAEGKGGPSAAVQSAATPPVLGQATRKRQVIRDKDDDQPSKRSKGSDDD
ncbi:hypothetical protein FRB94_006231 [Tulasnella sp. JGI-2019a]|nr:hypothetical protein FRB93_006675 [Tulasnella sp. JGI-2019a]KAG8999333.1 hypothetical protein FRB94_006231 [Tulasnella sp. JGI-2019a]